MNIHHATGRGHRADLSVAGRGQDGDQRAMAGPDQRQRGGLRTRVAAQDGHGRQHIIHFAGGHFDPTLATTFTAIRRRHHQVAGPRQIRGTAHHVGRNAADTPMIEHDGRSSPGLPGVE